MPDKPDGILLSDPVLGPASPGRRVRLNVIYLRRKPAVNIPAKPSPTMAKAEGSGVGVMSTPQLLSVLVPPPEDKSTKNKVHVPFSVIPPKVPSKVLVESGCQIPVGTPVAEWMLPFSVPLSLNVTLKPAPDEPNGLPVVVPT